MSISLTMNQYFRHDLICAAGLVFSLAAPLLYFMGIQTPTGIGILGLITHFIIKRLSDFGINPQTVSLISHFNCLKIRVGLYLGSHGLLQGYLIEMFENALEAKQLYEEYLNAKSSSHDEEVSEVRDQLTKVRVHRLAQLQGIQSLAHKWVDELKCGDGKLPETEISELDGIDHKNVADEYAKLKIKYQALSDTSNPQNSATRKVLQVLCDLFDRTSLDVKIRKIERDLQNRIQYLQTLQTKLETKYDRYNDKVKDLSEKVTDDEIQIQTLKKEIDETEHQVHLIKVWLQILDSSEIGNFEDLSLTQRESLNQQLCQLNDELKFKRSELSMLEGRAQKNEDMIKEITQAMTKIMANLHAIKHRTELLTSRNPDHLMSTLAELRNTETDLTDKIKLATERRIQYELDQVRSLATVQLLESQVQTLELSTEGQSQLKIQIQTKSKELSEIAESITTIGETMKSKDIERQHLRDSLSKGESVSEDELQALNLEYETLTSDLKSCTEKENANKAELVNLEDELTKLQVSDMTGFQLQNLKAELFETKLKAEAIRVGLESLTMTLRYLEEEHSKLVSQIRESSE